MSTPNTDSSVTQPDSSTGDQTDDKGGKTYTQEELDTAILAKLRGSGTTIAAHEATIAAYKEKEVKNQQRAEEQKRKQLEADGDLKGQLELERAEKAKLKERAEKAEATVSTTRERELKRLEVLSEDNAKRLKVLPKALHELAQDDDPDKMATRLSRAEKIAGSDKTVSVRGTSGRSLGDQDPPDANQMSAKVGTAIMGTGDSK